jgi:hypothetical protein
MRRTEKEARLRRGAHKKLKIGKGYDSAGACLYLTLSYVAPPVGFSSICCGVETEPPQQQQKNKQMMMMHQQELFPKLNIS